MRILQEWLSQQLSREDFVLEPLEGDASFRQYYRFMNNTQNYIAVHASTETENTREFVHIAHAFGQLNLHVPQVLASDLEKGFLLLTDLGDDVLFRVLNKDNADRLYLKALDELGKIQQCQIDLPYFDRTYMLRELNWFTEWFLEKHLKLKLSQTTQKMLKIVFTLLLDSAASQPQCCIHRDYHSRNLMLLPQDRIGILDFQDAMIGPVTYDLISLIRDCYIEWPAHQVIQWAKGFHYQYLTHLIPSQAEFIRYLDLMGIQRHLKAIFIFARKFHRDNVDSYLKNIPRALNYITHVSQHYPELQEFRVFLEDLQVRKKPLDVII
jgi:N-acetylmuramate 1-kinase